jgi:hypothetical protein
MESIQVVCNDLMDSDLEVVARSSSNVSGIEKAVKSSVGSQVEFAGMVWSKLTGKLFERVSGKARV